MRINLHFPCLLICYNKITKSFSNIQIYWQKQKGVSHRQLPYYVVKYQILNFEFSLSYFSISVMLRWIKSVRFLPFNIPFESNARSII